SRTLPTPPPPPARRGVTPVQSLSTPPYFSRRDDRADHAARAAGASRRAAMRFFGTACLLALSTLLAVYAVETYLTLRDPLAAQSLSRRVEGLRRRGYDAYPAYVPAYRFKVPSGQLPLSGVRRVRTVMGSDDRRYTVYDSDEFGFRNPRGLWHPGAQLALLGDSFVQGYGVPDGRDRASIMRTRCPRTLNLGMPRT